MSEVRAKIDIDAPPEAVYDVMLDPERLHEWVTIHRKVNRADSGEPREGFEMDQTLCLRHANFKVHWTLTEADRPHPRRGRAAGPRALTPAPLTGSRPTVTALTSSTRTSSRRPADSSAQRPVAWSWAACPNARRTRHLKQLKALLEQLTGNASPCAIRAVAM